MATENVRDRVVFLDRVTIQGLEATLNDVAQEGWQLEDVQTMVVNKGGGIYVGRRGFYFEPNILVFKRTTVKQTYRCIFIKGTNRAEGDTQAVNDEIVSQSKESYRLDRLIPLTMIDPKTESRQSATRAFIAVFRWGRRQPKDKG